MDRHVSHAINKVRYFYTTEWCRRRRSWFGDKLLTFTFINQYRDKKWKQMVGVGGHYFWEQAFGLTFSMNRNLDFIFMVVDKISLVYIHLMCIRFPHVHIIWGPNFYHVLRSELSLQFTVIVCRFQKMLRLKKSRQKIFKEYLGKTTKEPVWYLQS